MKQSIPQYYGMSCQRPKGLKHIRPTETGQEYRDMDGCKVFKEGDVYTIWEQVRCIVPTKRLHKSRKCRM